MSIVVFYLSGALPVCSHFNDRQMTEALALCQVLRNEGRDHVTMSTQLEGQVGGMGVSAVVDGKLPNGDDYQWSKAHRAGAKPQK